MKVIDEEIILIFFRFKHFYNKKIISINNLIYYDKTFLINNLIYFKIINYIHKKHNNMTSHVKVMEKEIISIFFSFSIILSIKKNFNIPYNKKILKLSVYLSLLRL